MPSELKKLSGFVGFSNLPNQVHRKSTKEGFEFTLLVVGTNGLGKATFINSLFNAPIIPKKIPKAVGAEGPKDVEIDLYTHELKEGGVRLKLNVLVSKNFGQFIDNSKSWEPILKAVEERYDSFLDQERRVNRRNMTDSRIHCCLYFINPTGHALNQLDVEFLKRLHERVNIIPVISKCDTLTADEKVNFKKLVLRSIEQHQISTYDISIDPEDDEATRNKTREFKDAVPFAVMGSEKEYDVGGKKVRARKYPWGTIEVENDQNSDFNKLRDLLIRTHMVELRFRTTEVLYEQYRSQKLLGDLGGDSSGSKNPLASFEEEKKQHESKMKKMEKEMKQVFEQKVKEKEDKLKLSEEKLIADHNEAKNKLDKEIKEYEEKRRNLNASLDAASQEKDKKPKKKSGLF